jgi:hypothetical protein
MEVSALKEKYDHFCPGDSPLFAIGGSQEKEPLG